MSLFIAIEVDPALAAEPAAVKRLAEVCPVDIYRARAGGQLELVDKNLDECTLCELCLAVGAPGQVRVVKLYDDGAVLARKA